MPRIENNFGQLSLDETPSFLFISFVGVAYNNRTLPNPTLPSPQ